MNRAYLALTSHSGQHLTPFDLIAMGLVVLLLLGLWFSPLRAPMSWQYRDLP